jgi:hypothetical protein
MWDYNLVSIEKTQPPVADEKGSWYQYVIANKITTVSGRRRGSKDEVTHFVKSCIQRLNTRHLQAAGKGISL